MTGVFTARSCVIHIKRPEEQCSSFPLYSFYSLSGASGRNLLGTCLLSSILRFLSLELLLAQLLDPTLDCWLFPRQCHVVAWLGWSLSRPLTLHSPGNVDALQLYRSLGSGFFYGWRSSSFWLGSGRTDSRPLKAPITGRDGAECASSRPSAAVSFSV